MDRTVRDHIYDLEQRRDLLNGRITQESDAEQRKQVETELRAVESTLKFYRDALETERRRQRPELEELLSGTPVCSSLLLICTSIFCTPTDQLATTTARFD